VDVREKRQRDVAKQVAIVKARARPWRSIIALALAIVAITAGKWLGAPLSASRSYCADHQVFGLASCGTAKAITVAAAVAFLIFGLSAVLGLSAKAQAVLSTGIGSAHAGIVRYALVLAGAIIILLTTLGLLNVSVGQLIVGGALTGVLIGIAAQQALANVFAGIVLIFARPFSVGDRVWIRSGALSGTLEGTIAEIGISYVRLDSTDGMLSLPNSQVLAAVVGPAGQPAGQPAMLAAWQPGNPEIGLAGAFAAGDGAGDGVDVQPEHAQGSGHGSASNGLARSQHPGDAEYRPDGAAQQPGSAGQRQDGEDRQGLGSGGRQSGADQPGGGAGGPGQQQTGSAGSQPGRGSQDQQHGGAPGGS
jgi:hypothetical protein